MLKEITSKDHPLIKRFTKLRINRDFRQECRRVIVEGEKLVHDVLKVVPYFYLLTCDRALVASHLDMTQVTLVSEELMKKISGMEHPPKMMAEVDMPHQSALSGSTWVLALDRLQDPGNLGTLFRTALALGWEGVCLIGDSVDPYNDKALRASQGATLLLPWRQGSLEEFEMWTKEESMPLFAADLTGSPPKPVSKGCLILGTEGEGLHPQFKQITSVTIPIAKKVDSLNVAVAGAILMYELKPKL